MERGDGHQDMTDIAEDADRMRDDRADMQPTGRDARPETEMAPTGPEGDTDRQPTGSDQRSGHSDAASGHGRASDRHAAVRVYRHGQAGPLSP